MKNCIKTQKSNYKLIRRSSIKLYSNICLTFIPTVYQRFDTLYQQVKTFKIDVKTIIHSYKYTIAHNPLAICESRLCDKGIYNL
jgi:hypothetical protein